MKLKFYKYKKAKYDKPKLYRIMISEAIKEIVRLSDNKVEYFNERSRISEKAKRIYNQTLVKITKFNGK